eukprot:g9185.t1
MVGTAPSNADVAASPGDEALAVGPVEDEVLVAELSPSSTSPSLLPPSPKSPPKSPLSSTPAALPSSPAS